MPGAVGILVELVKKPHVILPGLDLTVRYEVYGSAFGDLIWTERWVDGRRDDARIGPSPSSAEPDVRVWATLDRYRSLQQGECCVRRFLELGGGIAGDWPLLMAYAGLIEEDAHREAMVVAGPTDEELAWARIVTDAEHVDAAAHLRDVTTRAAYPGTEP